MISCPLPGLQFRRLLRGQILLIYIYVLLRLFQDNHFLSTLNSIETYASSNVSASGVKIQSEEHSDSKGMAIRSDSKGIYGKFIRGTNFVPFAIFLAIPLLSEGFSYNVFTPLENKYSVPMAYQLLKSIALPFAGNVREDK